MLRQIWGTSFNNQLFRQTNLTIDSIHCLCSVTSLGIIESLPTNVAKHSWNLAQFVADMAMSGTKDRPPRRKETLPAVALGSALALRPPPDTVGSPLVRSDRDRSDVSQIGTFSCAIIKRTRYRFPNHILISCLMPRDLSDVQQPKYEITRWDTAVRLDMLDFNCCEFRLTTSATTQVGLGKRTDKRI